MPPGSRKRPAREIQAVDLFCGCGGLAYGLKKAGIKVRLGIDNDPKCEFAFEKNLDVDFLQADLRKVDLATISSAWSTRAIRVLAGCAPCQPFSHYTLRGRDTEDSRWRLLDDFAHVVKKLRPELVTMENVPRLMKCSVYTDFVGALTKAGYHVSAQVVRCADYGVPQRRRRLVLLASALGPITLLPPTHRPDQYVSVRSTIGRLPKLTDGETNSSDQHHRASKLSALNLRRIRAATPGGSWKQWDSKLRAACHRATTGRTYPSVYGRMSWDDVAPTITTFCYGFGNGRFGHPEQLRGLSLREAALLQTFPASYQFSSESPPPMKATARMIGNAVPVRLAEVIGRSLKAHVEDHFRRAKSTRKRPR